MHPARRRADDVVGGNIIVEVDPGAAAFSVRSTIVPVPDIYPVWGVPGPTPQPTTNTYVWSKKSRLYHVATCLYAKNISEENRQVGDTPPQGKSLQQGCPR